MKLRTSNSVDANKARVYLDSLIKKGADIELKEVRKARSVDQNSYLHVCLAIFCNESGYMMDEAKEIFSQLLPEMLRYERNGFEFRKSTSTLDTKEMSTLIEKIRSVCSEELGTYVPTSEEYMINKFAVDRDIQHVR
jgi:hypothetical protein